MFWNHLHIAPIRANDGRLAHYVGLQLDITEAGPADRKTAPGPQAAAAASHLPPASASKADQQVQACCCWCCSMRAPPPPPPRHWYCPVLPLSAWTQGSLPRCSPEQVMPVQGEPARSWPPGLLLDKLGPSAAQPGLIPAAREVRSSPAAASTSAAQCCRPCTVQQGTLGTSCRSHAGSGAHRAGSGSWSDHCCQCRCQQRPSAPSRAWWAPCVSPAGPWERAAACGAPCTTSDAPAWTCPCAGSPMTGTSPSCGGRLPPAAYALRSDRPSVS